MSYFSNIQYFSIMTQVKNLDSPRVVHFSVPASL